MFKKSCIFLFIFFVFTFLSCSKQKENDTVVINPNENEISEDSMSSSDSKANMFVNPKDFFTLDFTPYTPEEKFQKKNILDYTSKTPSTKGSNATPSKSVIPGLREIKDYEIKYNTSQPVNADELYEDTINQAIENDEKLKKANKEPFTIVTWGPQKEIPASIRKPEFYIIFSEAVVPLAALGSEITTSDIINITPPIEGVYRWTGTSTLSFIPTVPIKPSESYKITVNSDITSLQGKKLTGIKEFNTTSEKLKINWFDPGYNYKENHYTYFSDNDVPPMAAKELRVRFNYLVDANDIKQDSHIFIGKTETKNFDCVQENKDTVTYYIKDDIPTETEIKLQVKDTNCTYNTVQKFEYRYNSTRSSYGKYSNPVYIEFSHPIDKELFLKEIDNNISTSLDYKLTEDNININESTIILYDLPVTFKSTYTVTLKSDITDIYGRKLNNATKFSVEVPDADSESNFTNYGSCILEAKYPHLMVFEHQNLLEDSYYYVEKTDNPLFISHTNKDIFSSKDNIIPIKSEPKNVRILEKVDLDPYLENGKGMVRFEAITCHPLKRNGEVIDSYTNSNSVTIQVTDLGVTTRMGINKTVCLVTNLSDGKPVKGATVYLYDGSNGTISSVLENKEYFKSAITDTNGLAVLNYDAEEGNKFFNTITTVSSGDFSYSQKINPAILVTMGEDKVTYVPSSHSPWKNGIYSTSSISTAIDVKPATFMFCDRGLYKPGEKVTFRGIDKNLNLGTYLPYNGSYEINIKENGWETIDVLEKEHLEGITTDNGGFYGSFVIPEDATPGNYTIEYIRTDDKGLEHTSYINFQVAFFERLKFQASMKMPEGNITSGDTIQGTASASYLAGGVLSGATYRSSWYSEPWYFESEDSEFEDYRFGPVNTYDNMSFISNDSGILDGMGKAIISCNSTDNSIKGTPYRYKASVDITDASNQMISTTGSVVVHPASYYIGLSKPKNVNYLAKKGEKLNFDYKLSLLDGHKVPNNILKNIAGKSPKLKVELLREEWNVVQQQGINGDVYPRYVKETITESSNEIELKTKDSISVTPQEVGYYTVRLSSKDSKDREVITEYTFFATGSTNSWVMDTQDAEIKLTPDQNLYNPGDKATILLESPLPSGNYLITVEREGIFSEEVVHFDSSVNTIEVPIARNYVPVCYVSVSSYSVRTKDPDNQYGIADVDKPKGYYGATTLHINPYVKAFSVEVESEKLAYKPGEEATITVTATKGGKPLANAEITLLAVDRGVLDLINYHIPNPIEYFYSEDIFPLCVKGGDNRTMLMDPVTYAVKNLAGGDAFMAESSMDKLNERKDFNPTALFEPVLITDKDGKATCKFTLPDTLTTYRITAFGVKDELLALQENEFAVQNQINVQQVTPRRLRERDTAETGVILTNLDSISHEITVELNTTIPTEIEEINGVKKYPGSASVDGKNKHTITVNPGDTVSVYFDVAAKKSGIINCEYTITSDILNEKLIYPLTIDKPYIYETVTTTGSVTDNEKKQKEGIIIPRFAEDGLGSLSITLDATRLGPLGSAVNYVFTYPYGCLEQQASKILPLVLFEEYIDVFNMDLDDKITDIHSLVTSYFSNWNKYQMGDGGFGYWPSSTKSSYYVTSRIAETYAKALERGYTEEELKLNKDNLINYLVSTIIEDKNEKDIYLTPYERVYMKYVISLLDSSKVSVKDVKEILNNEESDVCTLAISGLTALNLGDKNLANEFKIAINKYLRPNAQSIDITDNDESVHFYIYNSKSEQLALTLQLFASLDDTDPLVTKLIYTLLREQQAGYWQSTAATARVFDAFYTLIKESNLDKLNLKANCSIDGKEIASGKFEGVTAKPVKKEYLFTELGIKSGKLLPLEFEKKGRGDLYYTASMKYALPSEIQVAKERGISLTYKLFNDDTDEEITFDSENSSVIKLKSGTMYRMEITISSPKDISYVALRSPIPSGCEIVDSTFVTSPKDYDEKPSYYNYGENDQYDDGYYSGYYFMSNQNIMDNEIQFFWDYFQKGTTTASFKFRAARRGVYPTPPITAECMYESEIFGRTYGSLYTIE